MSSEKSERTVSRSPAANAGYPFRMSSSLGWVMVGSLQVEVARECSTAPGKRATRTQIYVGRDSRIVKVFHMPDGLADKPEDSGGGPIFARPKTFCIRN